MRSLILIPAMLAAAALAARPAPPPSAPPPAPAVWSRCAVCHANAEGETAEIGPNLWGVGGARAGARPGFDYSAALKASRLVWSRPTLARWLDNPQAMVPGTTMARQTLTPAERDALVAYLLRLK